MIPVAGARIPTRGILSFMYFRGYRDDGTKHYHRGIDLAAPKGKPVVAAESGVVTRAIDSYTPGFRGYGKTVVVRSNDGIHYLYAHLDRISVRKGDWVKRGEQLGTVGYTAYTKANPKGNLGNRAPHLHFETADSPYPKHAEARRLDPTEQLAKLSDVPDVVKKGSGALLLALLAGAGLWLYMRPRKPWGVLSIRGGLPGNGKPG